MKFVSIYTLFGSAYAGSLFTVNVQDKLTQDFLTGFESGIFLRNDEN